MYAQWGMDVIEADCFMGEYYPYNSPNNTVMEFRDEIAAMHDAIAKSSNPGMVLRVMPGNNATKSEAAFVSDGRGKGDPMAKYYRITGDFWDSWEDYHFFPHDDPHAAPPTAGVRQAFRQGAKFASYTGTNGAFADLDGMPLGEIGCGTDPNASGAQGKLRQSRLTRAEQRTTVALYAMLKAPMIVESHMPITDPVALALLTNPALLKFHDRSGPSGQERMVHGCPFYNCSVVVWSALPPADRSSNSSYLAVFNTWPGPAVASFDLADAGLSASATYAARDVWKPADGVVSTVSGRYEGALDTHDVVLLELTPRGAAGSSSVKAG